MRLTMIIEFVKKTNELMGSYCLNTFFTHFNVIYVGNTYCEHFSDSSAFEDCISSANVGATSVC